MSDVTPCFIKYMKQCQNLDNFEQNGEHSEASYGRHRAISFLQPLDRLLQFNIEIWKNQRDSWRSFTANNFIAQGMAKTTIYRIVKRFEQEGSVA